MPAPALSPPRAGPQPDADALGQRAKDLINAVATALLCAATIMAAWHDAIDSAATDTIDHITVAMLVAAVLAKLALQGQANRVHGTLSQMRTESERARAQVEELFGMTDMLQAADSHDDAGSVLMATTQRLLPGLGAALYVFNNSRDRLDLAKAWGMPEGFAPPDLLSPSNCWALKRGKAHVNAPLEGSLCCPHHGGSAATVELPMMACGQVHGLLVLALRDGAAQAEESATARLRAAIPLGRALADAMSLALSNIALREQLRTQSLRDPLTGLYNRRYMEDALERFLSLASRTGGSTAVIMLDLDDFKRLNDEHGHAKGDAVLRAVASQIVGTLRPSDVICRYGGEELVAILPDCTTADAALKAETLRERIAALSEVHGAKISASLGVAAVPENAVSASDIVPLADHALYEAKKAGKNCVKLALPRADRETVAPRLAVSRGG